MQREQQKKRVFLWIVFLLPALLYLPSPARATEDKIQPWVMKHTSNGKSAEFLVILADQANLSYSNALPSKAEKGRYVFSQLFETAERSQQPLRQFLRNRRIGFRSFYIVNALLVRGGRKLAEDLSLRSDVERIEGNPTIKVLPPVPEQTRLDQKRDLLSGTL